MNTPPPPPTPHTYTNILTLVYPRHMDQATCTKHALEWVKTRFMRHGDVFVPTSFGHPPTSSTITVMFLSRGPLGVMARADYLRDVRDILVSLVWVGIDGTNDTTCVLETSTAPSWWNARHDVHTPPIFDAAPPPGIPPRPKAHTTPRQHKFPEALDRARLPLTSWLEGSADMRASAYHEFGDPTLSYSDVANLVYAALHGRYPALRPYVGWCVGRVVRPQDVGVVPGADLRGMNLQYARIYAEDIVDADLRGTTLPYALRYLNTPTTEAP